VSYFGAYQGSYAGSWWGYGPAIEQQPPATGGGGGPPPRRGRIVYITRRVEEAAEKAAQGDFDEAARVAREASKIAASEARKAADEDAEALDALSRDILDAGERLRAAQEAKGLERLQALVAFRAALQAAYAVQARLMADDEEMAVLALLLLH
jgi:hypothetical protein